MVKLIFEYSNIRSVCHIRIFVKSHSSIRYVTSNAVPVLTCTPNTVQCVQPACDFVLYACTCPYWTANGAHNMYELRSSLMWQYIYVALPCVIPNNNDSIHLMTGRRACDVISVTKRIFVHSFVKPKNIRLVLSRF